MAQLEQRLRESDLQVHGALLGRGASYGDMCVLRLQVGRKKKKKRTLPQSSRNNDFSWPFSKTMKPLSSHGFAGASERERVPEGAVC